MAAETDNVELIRRIYELHQLGELDEATSHFADDVEWIEPAENPGATTYQGPSAARASHDEWSSTWGELELRVHELTAVEDRVLARLGIHVTGAGSGAPLTFEQWQVWTVREGEVVRMQMFYDEAEAKRVVGTRTELEETQ